MDVKTAKVYLQKAIKLNPFNTNNLTNYGTCLYLGGEIEKAIKEFEKGLKINLNDWQLRYNLAIILLLKKQFTRGWELYESRLQFEHYQKILTNLPNKSFWTGQELKDKVIFFSSEQGFGDNIQFVRFLKQIQEQKPSKIFYQCQESLIPLFKQNFPEVEFLSLGQSIPEYDYICPIASLGKVLNLTTENVSPKPYLKSVFPIDLEIKKDRLSIGIVWATSSLIRIGKAIQLKEFEEMIKMKDINFVSLQYGEPEKEIKKFSWAKNIIPTTQLINDFCDTASIINDLDLVVSIDTSVAHLAGSMGKKTFIIIPKAPDWRWEVETKKCYWYESAELFRQTTLENWTQPIKQIIERLKKIKK